MDSFLGKGWAFPPRFNSHTGWVDMVSGEADIAESIRILLDTRLGERITLPEYGCNLDLFMFEQLDTTLLNQAQHMIQTSLILHEPRIKVLEVKIEVDEHLEGYLNIQVSYLIKQSNSRFNRVFPFYVGEGTQVIGE